MACFQGKKYRQRNVGFEGDPESNMPSSIDYITNIAKGFANLNQKNYVVYIRESIINGKFYDFIPEERNEFEVVKLIRFDRKPSGEDVLQDSGDGESEPIEPEKPKSKPRKAKRDLDRY